tara:strand:+ start:110 stop:385 length:276 start_codon:yes stop_codon:yes gene_type:complete
LYLIILLADLALPSAVLGPVEYPPWTLHLTLPFFINIPGALQGLLPCFVSVSHCNLNLYLITVLNSYQDVSVGKKKKEKKKNKLQDLAILF